MSGNRQYKLSASNIGWDKKDDPRVIARMKELGYQGLEIAPHPAFPRYTLCAPQHGGHAGHCLAARI